MLKKLWIIWILFALLLAACSQSTATVAPTQVEATDDNQETVEAMPSVEEDQQPEKEPGCTVRSPQPTPGPTAQALLPPVSADDWVQGPEDAYVTIIEYGDFQ